jgi:hypothetical protein
MEAIMPEGVATMTLGKTTVAAVVERARMVAVIDATGATQDMPEK